MVGTPLDKVYPAKHAALQHAIYRDCALTTDTGYDDHWGRAEGEGDVAYLAQLLAPEYRSVSSTGKATTRAALLEHTARRASSVAARDEARKAREAFMAAHPTGVSVVIHGSVGGVGSRRLDDARNPDDDNHDD